MSAFIRQVTIDVTQHPKAGSVQMILRTTVEDKRAINKAARVLGIPQASFLRVAALNVAKRVLEEQKA